MFFFQNQAVNKKQRLHSRETFPIIAMKSGCKYPNANVFLYPISQSPGTKVKMKVVKDLFFALFYPIVLFHFVPFV